MHSRSTVNHIYSELRQQIVSRSIPPGTKFSENLLSKKWKVSRTPIREVLRRLESEDLVICQPYKGFIVNPITIADIDQLYIVRISLEGLAGRLATPVISADPKKLKALEKLCKEMEVHFRKGNIEAYIAKNNKFHNFILHSCENKWLIKILENLNSQVNRFIVKALHVPHRMEKSLQEHREIYKRLRTGNAKGAEKAIQMNHRKALEDLKRELTDKI
jgi:DNA-binding GntR family transcriptional regulator